MKKLVASYLNMDTSKQTYVSDAKSVEVALQRRLDDLDNSMRTCYNKVRQALNILDKLNLDEYWYDESETSLDSPDEWDWFETVPDEEVQEYYDAYNNAIEVGDKVAALCRAGRKLKFALKPFVKD